MKVTSSRLPLASASPWRASVSSRESLNFWVGDRRLAARGTAEPDNRSTQQPQPPEALPSVGRPPPPTAKSPYALLVCSPLAAASGFPRRSLNCTSNISRGQQSKASMKFQAPSLHLPALPSPNTGSAPSERGSCFLKSACSGILFSFLTFGFVFAAGGQTLTGACCDNKVWFPEQKYPGSTPPAVFGHAATGFARRRAWRARSLPRWPRRRANGARPWNSPATRARPTGRDTASVSGDLFPSRRRGHRDRPPGDTPAWRRWKPVP